MKKVTEAQRCVFSMVAGRVLLRLVQEAELTTMVKEETEQLLCEIGDTFTEWDADEVADEIRELADYLCS